MKSNSYDLATLAKLINATIKGDASAIVTGIAALEYAKSNHITFLSNMRLRPYLQKTQAGAVILTNKFVADCPVNALIVEDTDIAYAKVAELFFQKPTTHKGIHPSVLFGEACIISDAVSIGAGCVLGDRVSIGKNVTLQPGCVIGDDVTIGDDSYCYANVTIYQGVTLGMRAIIHSGAVIGADGFGLAQDRGHWSKVAQLGAVTIGDDVEIGANTCIDRGAIHDTVIEQGVKIDNLVQIAHNVHIGAHTVIAGCTGVAGSATIGKHCMIAGGVSINGHISLCDQVVITGRSVVEETIDTPGVYSSGASFIQPTMTWKRNNKRFAELDKMAKRIKQLEKKRE